MACLDYYDLTVEEYEALTIEQYEALMIECPAGYLRHVVINLGVYQPGSQQASVYSAGTQLSVTYAAGGTL